MTNVKDIKVLREGLIDRKLPYFELRYIPDPLKLAPARAPAALVGAPTDGTVHIEFVIDERFGTTEADNAIWRSVEFYLLELSEPEPWVYAQYHCTTAANIYSDVHWSYSAGDTR